MAPFHWPETRHDLALAKEVAQYVPEKQQEWEDIAKRRSAAFSTEAKQVELKGRVAEREWKEHLISTKRRMPRFQRGRN